VCGIRKSGLFVEGLPATPDKVASRMQYRKTLTPEQVFQKLRHYCAYQERCQQEVRAKLYTFGINKTKVEELLTRLIEEDLVNEERYSIQYAGGKFRVKEWGKIRIRAELRQRKISTYCIEKALNAIDPSDYEKTLMRLCQKKWTSLRNTDNPYVKHAQTASFLQQRGFEPELIQRMLRDLK
jgi:regulatory protein